MKIIRPLSIKCCFLLLLLACLWNLSGAPLTQDQWKAIPDTFTRVIHQIPARMQVLFLRWFAYNSV